MNNHQYFLKEILAEQCPGSSIFNITSAGKQKEGIILYCSADYLSGELHTKLKIMQWEFLLNKRLTF